MKLDQAMEVIEKARREAESVGAAMSFAVVDLGGHVVALVRMDGASFLTADIATGKAFTSAAFKAPSADVAQRLEGRAQFSASIGVVTHGRFMLAAGAVPIASDGQVVGAIGASGGTPEQDVAAVTAGIAV